MSRMYLGWSFIKVVPVPLLQEAADTLGRRDRQAATNVWLESKQYPAYYLNT